MRVIHDEWPRFGRVGVSRAQETFGQHVFVVADSLPGRWIVLLQDPAGNFKFYNSKMTNDNYFSRDEDVETALCLWSIEWIPIEDEDAIERDLFGMRSTIVAADGRASRRRRRLRDLWT
mgnify:FL=1